MTLLLSTLKCFRIMLAEIIKFVVAVQYWLEGCGGYSIINFYNGSRL
jgi:hypothetical protein